MKVYIDNDAGYKKILWIFRKKVATIKNGAITFNKKLQKADKIEVVYTHVNTIFLSNFRSRRRFD